jgi:AcrR family transcriptional regulator
MVEASHSSRPRRRGRPPRDESARPTRDRIVESATELFASRGIDGVSMREIAAHVGIDVSSVHHHFASKAVLYDACFARVYEQEKAALEPVVRDVTHAAAELTRAEFLASLHRLVDAFVDFLQDNPETTFLWLRRWLDPAGHTPLDKEYALPLYTAIELALLTATSRGLAVEPTPHVTVRSLVWAVHGHVSALEATMDGVAIARERTEFRSYAHRFIDRLYADPGA